MKRITVTETTEHVFDMPDEDFAWLRRHEEGCPQKLADACSGIVPDNWKALDFAVHERYWREEEILPNESTSYARNAHTSVGGEGE
jgi:hypothetical protein